MRRGSGRGTAGLDSLKSGGSPELARLAVEAERLIEDLVAGEQPSLGAPGGVTSRKSRNKYSLARGERLLDRRRRMERWFGSLADESQMLSITKAVLLQGASFNALDRRFHRRNGWARNQLIRALQALDRLDTSGA